MTQVAYIGVKFFFQSTIRLRERRRLKNFLNQLLYERGQKHSGELRIIFCSDEELLRINREYLNHDYYTDIITFPFSEDIDCNLDAELYISTDRVRDNAKATGGSASTELHRVIFHGCLHLCGFEDKTRAGQKEVRDAEDRLLAYYFGSFT